MFEQIKNFLLNIDIKIFKFINIKLHNEFIAKLMKWTANDIFLIIVLFIGLIFLIKKYKENGKIAIAFSLIGIIITNIINTNILKVLFKRQRPAVELQDIYFLVHMKRYGYAFPSTHTAMATVLAAVLWEFKEIRPILALFVFFIGFFCIYTGGHYPFDVLGGFIVGFLIGRILNILKNKYKKELIKNK